MYFCGVEDLKTNHTILVLVLSSSQKWLISFHSLPKDRNLITLELYHKTHTTLVSCCSLTMVVTEQEKQEFYSQLCKVVSSCHHRDKLILMGDFNGRVGSNYQACVYLVAIM